MKQISCIEYTQDSLHLWFLLTSTLICWSVKMFHSKIPTFSITFFWRFEENPTEWPREQQEWETEQQRELREIGQSLSWHLAAQLIRAAFCNPAQAHNKYTLAYVDTADKIGTEMKFVGKSTTIFQHLPNIYNQTGIYTVVLLWKTHLNHENINVSCCHR